MGLPTIPLGRGIGVFLSELEAGKETDRQVPEQHQRVEDEVLPYVYP